MLKNRKKIWGIVLSAVLVLTVSACGNPVDGSPQKGASGGYQFTDDMGRTIVLQAKPQNVAVLFSSFAEVWELAGGEVSITVGESIERGFADENAVLVDDGAGKTVNTELLIDAQPDFVICSADLAAQTETAELLNSAGIPAACFHVDTFPEYLNMLKICTDITGDQGAYETYGTQVQAEIRDVLTSVPEAEKDGQKRILFVRAGSKYSATKAKTAENNFVCVMLNELGTYNIAENAPVLLDGLSLEEILLENPDFIFISTMGDEAAAKAYMDGVLREDAWQHLDAVRDGRYAYLPKELFQFKPNKRWSEAYRYLAGLLYPGEN